MKKKLGGGGADVSENTPPQDESLFRNSPRTRRTSLLDISAPSPVFQRSIASKIAKKNGKPILNKSVAKIRKDNMMSSPASPILGRRRPTLAKKLAVSSLESSIYALTSEDGVKVSPDKDDLGSASIGKKSPHVSPPLSVRHSNVNLMSPPLSERKNFQNEIQSNQSKEPVKRKARNVQSHLDKENVILNPNEIEIPVKRKRRNNAITEITIQESFCNFENDMIDNIKQRRRGRKVQNSNENDETIANQDVNEVDQKKIIPKKRSGRKNDSNKVEEVKTKELSDKSATECKEENKSNSKVKKGAQPRKKIEEINEPIIEPSITIAPRRGRRAALLEKEVTEKQKIITEKQTKTAEKKVKNNDKQTKITDRQTRVKEKETKSTVKQTKINSFLSQSVNDDSNISKPSMKTFQSKGKNINTKTKQLKNGLDKLLIDNVTLSPKMDKKMDKSQISIVKSPNISSNSQIKQKVPIWASVSNKKSKETTPGRRKSHRRTLGSGHKDVFEFSFDVEADVNPAKKKKGTRKPRAKKEKPKPTLKPTLLVTDPSWQKPLPHSRKKNATPYSRLKDTISSSVTKTISKREALAAKIREKKKEIEESTLSQESNATSGYTSQTPKQSNSQESYIAPNRTGENDFSGFRKKSNKVRDIPDIDFDDDEGCDIHANDFDDYETEVVERLEYETTSSFRPPHNALMSDSVLPTPVVSSRMFSKFIVGASTPMADHVKSSNIFRDPEPPKTVVASTPMTNHVKSSSIFCDPEPPKTVVEDVQQCFGFDDIENNPLNISPVQNSFAQSSINSCFEVTGMTVNEEDRQPSRFDFGSIYRSNRSNRSNHSNMSASIVSQGPGKTLVANSRNIQKKVTKQKIINSKSPASTRSIQKNISNSKKSPSATKSTKICEENLLQGDKQNDSAEKVVDNSVLFDEEPLEDESVSKALKEVDINSQNNANSNKIIPVSEVPSPEKSFTKPANKIYDRRSLNESRQKFLKMYSGADASSFGDNEEDEQPKKSKKQKSSTKSKKVNTKVKNAILKSGKEKTSKKVLAKRACKDTRKVNFDSSGDSTFDSSQEEEKRVKKKTKKQQKLDKSVEDWASDLNSHFSEVEDIELVIG